MSSLACTQSSWSEATWPRCAQACLPQVQQPGLVGPGAWGQPGGTLLRRISGALWWQPGTDAATPRAFLQALPLPLTASLCLGALACAGPSTPSWLPPWLLGRGKSVWGLSSCTLASLKENDPHRQSSGQTQPLCCSGDWSWYDFGDSWESRSPDLTPSCSGAPPSATCSWGHQAG